MLSNLLKYNSFVVKDSDDFVIDSNQKVMDKISSIKKNIKAASFITPGEPDADGFVSGLSAQVVEELNEPDEETATQEEINVQTEEILEAARNEADSIINQAHREAEYFINAAKDEGYEQGLKNGSADVEKRIKELETEYENKKNELETEYRNKMSEIEPELVDTLLKVFSKVTHTMAEDKKDMIICLINSVMNNTDISREFIIHVSPEDYRFAISNQHMISGAVSKDTQIEITEDSALKRNECLIETDAGVFDCSLDVQLDNLIKDIRLLSCMGTDKK